jgi:hypothetical protein
VAYDFTDAAAEFLKNTDVAYDECASGISELDRIIVASPSALADRTRGYLVMCLYAFWERFFRVAFGEYVRCIGLVGLNLGDVQESVARTWLRRELTAFGKRHKGTKLHDLADHHAPKALRQLLGRFVADLESPLCFDARSEWVETESNVRFSVIEKHCKRYGVDLDAIKADFSAMGSLHTRIEGFVDDRNDVAHGGRIPSAPQADWESTRSFVLKLLQSLQFELHRTILEGNTRLVVNGPVVDEFQI